MDTLDRLASAVLLPGFPGLTAPRWLLRRLDDGLGGVVLFGRNVAGDGQVATLTAALRRRDDVVIGIDEEGGDVTRLDARTGSDLPGPLALAVAGDLTLTERVSGALGDRLARLGITLDLAPCADLGGGLDDPIIGVRAFGADPFTAASHVGAAVRGLQSAGVAACAKHFPGHGASTSDSHLDRAVLPRTGDQLRAGELVPFRAAVAAGVRAVMPGHLVVPEWGAEPATLNPVALGEVLRGELGFTGAIVTDALEMGAVAGRLGDRRGMARAAVLALRAGADALCVGGEAADEDALDALTAAIVAAVRAGELPEERLAEAGERTASLGRQPLPGGLGDDPDLGLVAARRAVRVSALPALPERFLAVDVDTAPTIAAGPVPWGLGPCLAELLPGITAVRGTPGERFRRLAAYHRVIVVTTRDAHRHPRVTELVEDLVRIADVVVHVETGVPGPHLGTAGRVDTHGGSRACLRAAAELLARSADPGFTNPAHEQTR